MEEGEALNGHFCGASVPPPPFLPLSSSSSPLPTNNVLSINFRLSSGCRNFVDGHRPSMRIGRQACENMHAQRVHAPTELFIWHATVGGWVCSLSLPLPSFSPPLCAHGSGALQHPQCLIHLTSVQTRSLSFPSHLVSSPGSTSPPPLSLSLSLSLSLPPTTYLSLALWRRRRTDCRKKWPFF